MRRILAIALKELRQLSRDRLTLAMMVMIPIVQLLLFGWAINTDVRDIPTVVLDHDSSAASREIVRSLEASGSYAILGRVEDEAEVERALRSGRARVAIVVDAHFAAALERGETARVQLVVDGSDPQTVASATQTATALGAARSLTLTLQRLSAAGGRHAVEPLHIEPTTWYNPELRTAVYIVPGLVGVILTMTMVMLTSMGIARERERGTLEQLIVSPVTSLELTIGKIVPYVIIGYVQVGLILTVAWLVFDVPIVGSIGLLLLLAFLFISANLALGLFFSTIARTQQQAMQMSFFFLLPSILLSGFMFPFEGMPVPAQVIAYALPLTHFLRIVRGIVLKGAGLMDLWGPIGWLTGLLVVLVTLSALRFQKKLG